MAYTLLTGDPRAIGTVNSAQDANMPSPLVPSSNATANVQAWVAFS